VGNDENWRAPFLTELKPKAAFSIEELLLYSECYVEFADDATALGRRFCGYLESYASSFCLETGSSQSDGSAANYFDAAQSHSARFESFFSGTNAPDYVTAQGQQ
jgi:hypothetical protein